MPIFPRPMASAVAFAATLIFSAVRPAVAQRILEPGGVVRVHLATAGDAMRGTLVDRTPDSMTVALRDGGLLRVARSSVTALDVHDGRRHAITAARWAIVGGAIWGGVAATIPYRPCDPNKYSNCGVTQSKTEFVMSQAVGMAVITGIIGAIRGEDRWVQVEGAKP